MHIKTGFDTEESPVFRKIECKRICIFSFIIKGKISKKPCKTYGLIPKKFRKKSGFNKGFIRNFSGFYTDFARNFSGFYQSFFQEIEKNAVLAGLFKQKGCFCLKQMNLVLLCRYFLCSS